MKKLNFLSMTFAFLLFVFILMGSPLPTVARAEVISAKYSNVLEDLQKDDNFNVKDYPEIANDYSLQVIQIAESTDKKLFIYVYQPSHNDVDLLATSINISLTGKAEDVKNYTLTLISSSGVFDKYIVNSLTISDEDVRTYLIPSVFRAWNKNIDEVSGTDNVINEVVFEVAQTWYATEESGQTVYRCKKIEVITITDRWDGFVDYDAGFDLLAQSCRSHFIAFNTDKRIDQLLEATVSFYHQSVYKYANPFAYPQYTFGKLVYEDSLELLSTQEGASESIFPWDKTYKWNRILSAEEFLKDPDATLSDTAKKNISSKSWVLRFFESSFSLIPNGAYFDTTYTAVTDVTILRLKFNTDGKTYDLGAVDKKMTADLIPDGHGNDPPEWWPIALAIVLVCVAGIVIYKSVEDMK